MSFDYSLRRMNPFEGLCLTAQDLSDEQTYHRRALHRHSLYMHGFGVVQGLQVELEQRKKKYTAVVKAGYGLTAEGQGVHLRQDVIVPIEVPKQDGEYLLWLFHIDRPDADTARPVFDTADTREARILEDVAPRMLPAEEEHPNAVALCRINVRLGRMVQVQLPVPRAGRQIPCRRVLPQAAGGRLHPSQPGDPHEPVPDLHRPGAVGRDGRVPRRADQRRVPPRSRRAPAIARLPDRRHAHHLRPRLLQPAAADHRPIAQFTEFVRRVNAEIPGPEQSDETWLKWFQQFERLLQPLQRINEELEKTVEAMR